jgi:hypothetical protein
MAKTIRTPTFRQRLFSPWGVLVSGLAVLATGMYIQRHNTGTPPCHRQWYEIGKTRDAAVLLSFYDRCSTADGLGPKVLDALLALEQDDYQRARNAGQGELARYIATWSTPSFYQPRHLAEAKETVRVATAAGGPAAAQPSMLTPVQNVASFPEGALQPASSGDVGIWDDPPQWWPAERRRAHYQRAYRAWQEEQRAKPR